MPLSLSDTVPVKYEIKSTQNCKGAPMKRCQIVSMEIKRREEEKKQQRTLRMTLNAIRFFITELTENQLKIYGHLLRARFQLKK